MSKPTVARTIVETLVRCGVERAYGIVGDSLSGIVDEVRRHPRLQWVGVRHEETGAFAAGAEAQLSGRLGVCLGSCGPGTLHLLNGFYDCQRSMAPVLAIAGQIPRREMGSGFLQESHPERLFSECSYFCELVSSAEQIPRLLNIAIQNAIGRRGVSVIVVPSDVAMEHVNDDSFAIQNVLERPSVRPADQVFSRLADLLNAGQRVTLLCGIGCADAHDQLLALSERLAAPVVHTLRGKAFVEHDNPADVGMTGPIGDHSGYHALATCDTLLMLGTDFAHHDWLPSTTKIAQVDLCPEHLGRRCRLDLGLVGDIRETLQALLPLLEQKSNHAHLQDAVRDHERAQQLVQAHLKSIENQRPIHPEFLSAVISELASDDAIFTVDTGTCAIWTARQLEMTRDRRLLGSFNHCSMASALPQAIGAQFLHPGRQVISLCGDGGFSMLMGDVLTVSQHRLPIKTILFNNSSLALVKLEMHAVGLPDYATDLVNPNFAEMANAIGVTGIRVEDPAEVRPAIQRALSENGPVLLDVVTNSQVLAKPPKISLLQAGRFGLALLKESLSKRAASNHGIGPMIP